jgi:Helix-turn-helix domain/RodZ C-terminal domain
MLEIGSTLRDARERRHLTFAEVEAGTLIPVRYLQALEQEQFERLPEGLYRRSFLREYADFLELDANALVADYELRFAEPPPEPEPAPRRRRRRPGEGAPSGRALLLGAVVVVAAVGLWLLGGGGGGSGPHSPTVPARTTTSAAGAAAPTTTTRSTSTAPAPKPPVLVLRAVRGPCWLSVTIGSSGGRLIYRRTLQQGGTVRFGLRRPLSIRIGAPWNLEATLAGTSITSRLPTSVAIVLVSAAGVRRVSG